jgi:hypothetical protein
VPGAAAEDVEEHAVDGETDAAGRHEERAHVRLPGVEGIVEPGMPAIDVSPTAGDLGAEHELAGLEVEAGLPADEPAVGIMAPVREANSNVDKCEALFAPAAASMRTDVETGPAEGRSRDDRRRSLDGHASWTKIRRERRRSEQSTDYKTA